MRRLIAMAGLLAAIGLAGPAQAQERGFVSGTGGAAISINDDLPEGSGAGWAVQGQAGLALARVMLGGEVSQFKTASDRKVKVFGAFLRVSSLGTGAVRPYLVTGLGAYRYSVADASRTSVGASAGPGALFQVRGTPLSILLEARFHTTFDRQPGRNTQQFLAVLAGAEVRF